MFLLHRYKEGLLALNGVLSLQESYEADLQATFTDNVGVAFLILGKLKYSLQHQAEASACFRAALRHNPFLWSAFVMLCEMGEEVNPEDCFKVSEYPRFLRAHPFATPPVVGGAFTNSGGSTPHQRTDPSSNTTHRANATTKKIKPDVANPVCAESAPPCPDSPLALSAFEPVVKKKPVYMTPDIYHDRSVGSAIASSTPAAPQNLTVQEKLSLTLGSSGLLGGLGVKRGHGLQAQFVRNFKGALDFESTGRSGQSTPQDNVPIVTPLNPW